LANVESPEALRQFIEQPVSAVMRPAYFVPDTAQLSRLLKDFTNNRRQMAIVVDEYGGTEGLITLEDILEEIVGDYEDEFTPRHRHIKKEDQHHYTINGGVRVTELEPKLNFPFPTGEYVTLGGLINQRLGRIATVGDIVQLEGAQLNVLEMDRHCVTKVLFTDIVQEEAVEALEAAESEGAAVGVSELILSTETPVAHLEQVIPAALTEETEPTAESSILTRRIGS